MVRRALVFDIKAGKVTSRGATRGGRGREGEEGRKEGGKGGWGIEEGKISPE